MKTIGIDNSSPIVQPRLFLFTSLILRKQVHITIFSKVNRRWWKNIYINKQ